MNLTEKYIYKFYRSMNINEPRLLSCELVIDYLDMKLKYWPHSSTIAAHDNRYIVFINESITMQQQWQEFGHEMYHYFYDNTSYDLLKVTYAEYGETKADYFAYHFCVPTFMLQNIKGVDVYDVMYLFNVEFDFALRRLEMYKSKCINRRICYERTHN